MKAADRRLISKGNQLFVIIDNALRRWILIGASLKSQNSFHGAR
jgi:hypothetical protein